VVKNGSNYEYQYGITDHQGNTRVVFTSNTPTPVTKFASFEGSGTDQSPEFTNVVASNVVSYIAANNTSPGIKVVQMNQDYSVGPAKSMKVYPGDAVDMEVYAYYESASGFGTSNISTSSLILNIVSGLTGSMAAGPDKTALTNGINSGLGGFGLGGNQGDNVPAAYLNYILFDLNYNPIDAGWQAVTSDSKFSKQKVSLPTKIIQEPGYIFVYLSYENQSGNYVYFDDFKVKHTPTNVIQSNEYYPFGLQTANSWTRDSNSNNFLYNEGSEVNTVSGFYDLPFRNYDAALGRFFQVDPLSVYDHTISPFAYAGNNPIVNNDPSGLMVDYSTSGENPDYAFARQQEAMYRQMGGSNAGLWANDRGSAGMDHLRDFMGMWMDAASVKGGGMDAGDYAVKYGGVTVYSTSRPVDTYIYAPAGGSVVSSNGNGNTVYNGKWLNLNSEEGRTLFNNKFGKDSRVVIGLGAQQEGLQDNPYLDINRRFGEAFNGFFRDMRDANGSVPPDLTEEGKRQLIRSIESISGQTLQDKDGQYFMRPVQYKIEFGQESRRSDTNPYGLIPGSATMGDIVNPMYQSTSPIYGNPGRLTPDGYAKPIGLGIGGTGNYYYITIYFQRSDPF
jgi:RHS repeat-associated protein